MRKRMISLALTLVIFLGILPSGILNLPLAQGYSASALSYGDYFILGRYLNEEIVWRHVGSDGYGDVALSFRVLTSKAYNSKGIKPANISVPDNIQIPQEVDPRGDRADFGSNIWVNSTLRAWLNSDALAGQTSYIGEKPSTGNVTANAYHSEAGFLSNFTPAERAAMAPTKHAAALNEVDSALKTAGTQVPGWDNGGNLTDPVRHLITDTVFLPDAHLLSRIANDSRLNWTVGYWSTGFHRAGITASAVAQAGITAQTPSGEYSAVDYWTGTPQGSQWGGTHQMQIRLVGGGHSFVNVNQGVMGVRPAFYINHDNITVTGGSGTQDDPYIIGVFDGSFGINLKGNNSGKLYTPDRDILQITAPAAQGLTLSYIMTDPESAVSIVNETEFNSYNPNPLSHINGKASLSVDRNAAVWVMAKGTVSGKTKTTFANITYKNFYEPVKIYQQGKTAEDDTFLYHAALIGGVYGVPVNKFRTAILGGVSYDEINVIPQTEILPQDMRNFWTRSANSPVKITLDDIKYYNNPQTITMSYEKIPANWVTVSFYFIDDGGNEITVDGVTTQPVTKTNWIPQGMTLSQAGKSYAVPSAADNTLTPYKWAMYDAADLSFTTPLDFYKETDGDESIGFDPQMPSDKTHVAIRIYYKPNQYMVTVNHIDTDTGDKLQTNMVSIASGETYSRNSAPKIDHFVAAGYQIEGNSRVNLPLDTDGKPIWSDISFIVNSNTTVTYFHAADANDDNVPDSEQVQLTTRRIGVYNDDSPNVSIQPDVTQTVLKNKPVTVTNDGAGGDSQHIIDAPPAKWIFDSGSGTASRTIIPDSDTTIRFYYNYDSKATGIPDINQGVTAKFAVASGSSLTYPQDWPDIFTNIVKGGQFIRAVPSRGGYTAVGWLKDGEDIASLRPFTGRNGNQAEFTTSSPNHTVTFVYRPAAAPVTIRWLGTALTGNIIEFGYVTVTGYIGETLAANKDKLRASVSVDTDSWSIANDNIPDVITFSNTPQEYSFYYSEKQSFYYDIHYLSGDGKILYEEKIPASTADSPFTVTARDFPSYGYLRYEILEFENLYAAGTEKTITLIPADGAMSVYFHYSPATSNVTVKAIEHGTDNEILTITHSGKEIGQYYSVFAPYIEGWALAEGEPVIRMVTVAEGGNIVMFYYERPASVFIHCIELRGGKETVLRTVPVKKTGEVIPPDLTGDYFDFDSGNAGNSDNPCDVTDTDFKNGKVIRYFYKSRMMDVKISAVDEDGNILSVTNYPAAARMGEMYTATAPADPVGHALADEPVKEIYADPALSVINVIFVYHRLAPGEVTVRHYYMDSGVKVILKEYFVKAEIGSGYTAYAEYFPGFSAAASSGTVSVTGGTDNLIELLYTDVRKIVTVQISKNGASPQVYETHKVPSGTVFTVYPPYVDGYSLGGYTIGGVEKTAGLAAIVVGTVTDSMTVTLNFVSYVNITVIGKQNDTQGGELFRFVSRTRYGQPFTLTPGTDLPKLDMWRLKAGQDTPLTLNPIADDTLEFYYENILTTVTINAQLNGGGSVPGFVPIVVDDVLTGSTFSYDAPYIPGYKPAPGQDVTQTIGSVAAGGGTLTFIYEALPAGNVHVILKEDDKNGRIISEDKHELALGYSMLIPVPNLSGMFYTALSTEKTVTYTGTDITVEYYYEKDTVWVVKKTFDITDANNHKLIAEFDMGHYRAGTNARFYAPSKENHELNDAALKIVRIIPPSDQNTRAVSYHEVPFSYSEIASDRLVVEAVSESGSILLSYNITGAPGEMISVGAPDVPGYKLAAGEPLSKSETVPGKIRFTYQRDGGNFADLTVTVKSTSGSAIQNAKVTVKSSGETVRSNTTDTTGKALLPDLPLGTYSVAAVHTGYNDGSASVVLDSDKSLEIKLSPTGGGSFPNGGSGGGSGGAQPSETETDSGVSDGLLEKTIHIKYINGFDDGTARPDAFITRAETAAIFYRLLKEKPEPYNAGFPDVSGAVWYTDAVNALAGLRIVSGYPDGTFGPGNIITRAEFTAVISRFEEVEKSNVNFFNDVSSDYWAAAYINSAYIKGFIQGYPNGGFGPDNPITRAEAVTIINRILDRKIRREDIPQSANIFPDLSENHWAYADFLEAATDHDYERDSDGFELWNLIR